MNIQIINGPNLNFLGQRQPDVYGSQSFEDYLHLLKDEYPDVSFVYFQSNIEGEIINKIQSLYNNSIDGLILNAGGYSHTSVAIHDALILLKVPFVEVHISNIYKREEFRHTLLLAPLAYGCITGFGLYGYNMAVTALKTAHTK